MKRKTLLTPEEQWKKTVAYSNRFLERFGRLWAKRGRHCLCIFHGTHPLVMDGDVLILGTRNGMVNRFGMIGVTSKGARLDDYHLPLRRGFELVELPDDLSEKQWDDPAIVRYVADLRASRRSRVSAYSPAFSRCPTFPGIDTNEITCFGLYKSGRTSRSRQSDRGYDSCDYRNYLRFYPDGSVIWTMDTNHGGWCLWRPQRNFDSIPRGIVRVENGCVTFELFKSTGDFFARYEGHFEHGRLWLSCDSPEGRHNGQSVAHGKLPYRFHPFGRNWVQNENTLSDGFPLPDSSIQLGDL